MMALCLFLTRFSKGVVFDARGEIELTPQIFSLLVTKHWGMRANHFGVGDKM
jgi:hypothetical protein